MERQWQAIAIDSGGTFTDVIGVDKDRIVVFKTPSTPKQPSQAVKTAIERLQSANEIFHGTTVATNAILERKGAEVTLITTQGFADVIEIGRQNRSDIYALYPSRTTPLVSQSHRLEVNERITAKGEVLQALHEEDLENLRKKIEELNPDAIAVCLLFSFLDPSHERMIAGKLADYPLSLSSVVHPEYREYERTSTTVIDAYIKPIINSYLNELQEEISTNDLADTFAVMKSDRGLALIHSITKRPVDTIFSGLAGGVRASEYASDLTNIQNLLTIDIGGTSTDVSAIINGKAQLQQSQKIDNLPVARPAVDVVTIGAGGGSLIGYDAGILRVGPESAGADPGPICYDQGGNIPTVTDVDLVLGILPDELAGGVLSLNKDLAHKALEEFTNSLDLNLEEGISGIRRIFHENIAGAIRAVSTQRGYDPREFGLLAFGGAGPVHAVEIAEVMKMTHVIIPPYPGVWSSMGLLGADYQYSVSQGLVKPLNEVNISELQNILQRLKEEVTSKAEEDQLSLQEAEYTNEIALRFVGQSYELVVDYHDIDSSRQLFIETHRERYGFAAEDEPVEMVALSVKLQLPHPNPQLPPFTGGTNLQPIGVSTILGIGEVGLFSKESLPQGTQIEGPKIIKQDDSTIWIPEDWYFEIDTFGFIHIRKPKDTNDS